MRGASFPVFKISGSSRQAFQGKDSQQRYRELCYDKDGRHGAELVVQRDVIDEEIRQRHEVLAPGQDDGEEGGSYQCPLQRSFHDEASQYEQKQDECSDVDGTRRHGLGTEILCQ